MAPPEDAGEKQAKRSSGRFAPGRSGNPRGRQKGTRNATTLAVEKLLDGEATALTRRAIELAKGGDTVALRLVMERVAPLRRGRPVHFSMPEIKAAGDVVAAIGGILKATAAGELTPEEAGTIASILETKRKAIELVNIEERLAALEQQAEKRRRLG